jgi:hypothetical protein
MSADIVARLRAEIAWEPEVGELMAEAADKIERLRLTEPEREAIAWAANESDYWAGEGWNSSDDPRYAQIAATLRGLLGRTR